MSAPASLRENGGCVRSVRLRFSGRGCGLDDPAGAARRLEPGARISSCIFALAGAVGGHRGIRAGALFYRSLVGFRPELGADYYWSHCLSKRPVCRTAVLDRYGYPLDTFLSKGEARRGWFYLSWKPTSCCPLPICKLGIKCLFMDTPRGCSYSWVRRTGRLPVFKAAGAFSLVELLTVLAIISTLGGLTVTALSQVSSSRASANGASLVADLLLSARQQAMSTGQPVAVVFSDRVRPEKPQAVMLLEGSWQNGALHWNPSSRWHMLGSEISVVPFVRDQSDSLYRSGLAGLESPLALPLQGENVTDYFYLIYRPNGSIDAPQIAPSVAIRRQNKESVNDYVVVAQENTGRIKIVAN